MDAIAELAKRQDGLITRRQALVHMSDREVDARLGRSWQVVLPGVYATFTGELTATHRRRAALLHGGEVSMLTDLDALDLYGVPYLPHDDLTRVLVPNHVQRGSRDFVVIRRTTRVPTPSTIGGLRVAPVARAACDFGRRHTNLRDAFAVLAAVVQTRRASLDDLLIEAERGSARGRPRLMRHLERLGAGVRSVSEDDFRSLILTSTLVPEPLWNPLLQLPDGTHISPDALIESAALIHETNGRQHHGGTDEFEDMQRRHDLLVATGFTVLHNTPRRIGQDGAQVLKEFEQTFLRLGDAGLPEGVVILRRHAPGQ